MKKSNKVSVFYVLASIALFLVLLIGGGYGVYVSVGLNFAKSSVPNIAEGGGGVSNVSIAGTVNYSPSMTGIILLSIGLVVLAIIDLTILIKQIVFFKQFKAVRNSKIEQKIERKIKSKGIVIFWTFVIDIVCFAVGILGVFVNGRSFAGRSNFSWFFYTVDIAVSVLSLLSIILLIIKLKGKKKESELGSKPIEHHKIEAIKESSRPLEAKDINQMEYNLIKLESMKKGKLISDEEYKKIRKKILNLKSPKAYINDLEKETKN